MIDILNYKGRLDLALKFIDDHLEEQLSLDRISKASFYSSFHFHRIFKMIMKETVHEYLVRLKMEKSALLLLHKNLSIGEISRLVGYGSTAAFSRSFKKFHGVNASFFKEEFAKKRAVQLIDSKNDQQRTLHGRYICYMKEQLEWLTKNAKVNTDEIGQKQLASITHLGVNNLEETFERLLSWVGKNPQFFPKNPQVVRVFHESFKVTSPEKIRMSICAIASEKIKRSGEISPLAIKSGKHIIAHFEILPVEFEKAWIALFLWMKDMGYEKREGPPFEIYQNDFREHLKKKCLVDFYIPIA